MNNCKKILFLVTRPFWRIVSGHETSIYHMCKGLHEIYGYDIYVFSFKNKSDELNVNIPDFIKHVRYEEPPSFGSSIKNIFMKSILGGNLPFQVSLYYNKAIEEKIKSYVSEVQPQYLFTDMVRMAPYAENINFDNLVKVLYSEDDLAKRYRRLIEKSASGNIFGYYSKNTPGIINFLASSSIAKKIVLQSEIKRLEKYEEKYVDLFDYIMFISPIETREFNERHKTDKAVTYTMGADIEFYEGGAIPEHINKSLIFIGNFFTPPNADSIEMICREIIPRLDGDTVLYAVGKCPDDLKSRISNSQVKVLGYVDDVRKIAKATDVCISPITYGTGIKTKIVEAMAMKIPVVTNSIGAEGLDVHNGKELFIAENPEEIADCIIRLLNDKELRRKIGNCGYEYAKANHDWKKVYEVFDKMGFIKADAAFGCSNDDSLLADSIMG